MMEPKEKAKELINKFDKAVNTHSNTPLKKCALIAVDELIIEENKYNNGSFYPSKFWQEVKQEIEKL